MLVSILTTAQQIPANYSTLPANNQHNFVRSYKVNRPGLSPAQVVDADASPADVQLTTEYFDGLGRPIQTVSRKASLNTAGGQTTPTDLVTAMAYDAYGRQVNQFLPYASLATNGAFVGPNPFEQQRDFYLGSSSPIAGQGETYFYSKTNFEPSPLNRAMETFAPGNSWVGSEGAANHSVNMGYYFNTATDDVHIWNVTDNTTLGNFGSYSSPGVYQAGQLYKSITTDEHGKQVIEFKDKEGKVVLKKVQLTATLIDDGSGTGYNGWICTYYIYDDFGNLRCVVQPEGVNWMSQYGWNFNTADGVEILAEQCFRYEYDHRQRMIVKKVPGAAEVYMVYDNRDRLVATSDGNGRSGTHTGYCYWMFTLYDALNRPVVTGEMHSCMGWADMQAHANGLNRTNETINLQPYISTAVTVYNPILGNASIAGSSVLSNWYANTVTYYDNYSWVTALNDWRLPATINQNDFNSPTWFVTTLNTAPFYVQPMTANYATTGMVTGTRTRVFNVSANSAWQTAVSFYDDNGRVLQTQSTNRVDGYDIATTQYDFAGRVHRVVHKQYIGTPTGRITHTQTRMEYDGIGRLTKTYKRLDYERDVQLSEVKYDALGQVKTKNLGQKKDGSGNYTVNNPLESINYDYNIRGWLLGANRDFLNVNTTVNPGVSAWFGFDLGYDKASNPTDGFYWGNCQQFNGNICGTVWRTAGDGVHREYNYRYDAANRLLTAFYDQRNGPGTWTADKMDFTMWTDHNGQNSVTNAYDLNGNIKSLGHRGWYPGAITFSAKCIDALDYTYYNHSNKLKAVSDQVSTNNNLGDFTNKNWGSDDYGYDANGNLVVDKNKRILGNTGATVTGGSITYNHLNLPVSVNISQDASATSKGGITYTYDAAGSKLKKEVYEANAIVNFNGQNYTTGATTITHYIGAFVYETKAYADIALASLQYTDKLQFVNHEEGRIRILYDNTDMPFFYVNAAYDYFLKDHLGNTRMVLTDEIKSDVYPTLSFEGTSGSPEVNNQNVAWEKANGQPFDVVADRVASSAVLINSGLQPPPLNQSLLVRSSTGKVGAGKLLKVMAGDKIHTTVQYYYPTASGSGTPNGLNTLLSGLATVIANSVGSGALLKTAGTTLSNGILTDPQAINFFTNQDNAAASNRPKAFLNVLFFDEQFGFDASASYTEQVGSIDPGQIVAAMGSARVAKKSGYCYIYISNESDELVYFDNLSLTHSRSSLMEESHYYPFGLTMAGISSKAAGKLDNRKGFNGNELQSKEFSDGSGLELYDFNARTYDQQVGRFIQIDPEFENGQENLTPYHFGNDNPIKYDDPTGKCPSCLIGAAIGFVTDAVVQVGVSVSRSVLNGERPSLSTVWRDYSVTQAFASTGAGLVTGGISAYEQGAAALVKTSVVNATFNAGNQLVDKNSINPTEVLIAAVPVPEVKGGNVVNVRPTERSVIQAQNRIEASSSRVPERKLTQLANAKAADAQAKSVNSTAKSTLSALREGSAKEATSTTYKRTSAATTNNNTSFFTGSTQAPVSDNTRAPIKVRLPQ